MLDPVYYRSRLPKEPAIPSAEIHRSASSQPAPSHRLPRELRLFLGTALALTALAWLTAALSALAKWGYPYTWPLAPRGTTLIDYRVYFDRFSLFHQRGFFTWDSYPFTYFAPGAVVYRALYVFGLHGGEAVYFALVIASGLCGCFWLRRALVRAGLAQTMATRYLLVSAMTSYPILFGAERGNVELLLAGGVALGLAAYCNGWLLAAAVLWGVFGSVKLYPLLLLALFLSYRQHRPLLAGLATAAATTLLSLWYIGPTLREAQAGIAQGTRDFLAICTLTYASFSWDHSLYIIPKLLLYPLGVSRPRLLTAYLLAAGGAMLVLYLLRVRRLPLVNQVVVLSVCTVLLPPTSFDYTLVQMYGAWAMLTCLALRAARGGYQVRGLAPAMVLLGILFTPQNLVGLGVSYGGAAKSLVLLTLLLLASCLPFTETPAAAQVVQAPRREIPPEG